MTYSEGVLIMNESIHALNHIITFFYGTFFNFKFLYVMIIIDCYQLNYRFWKLMNGIWLFIFSYKKNCFPYNLIVLFVTCCNFVAYCRAAGARGVFFWSHHTGPNTDRINAIRACNATFRCSVSWAWSHSFDAANGTVSCMAFILVALVCLWVNSI